MKFISSAIGVASLLVTSQALAVSGWVSGQAFFESRQGNYCDTTLGMDCTASRFPVSKATGDQPLRDVEVVVTLIDFPSPELVVGVGFTDRTGAFTVRWEVPGTTVPGLLTVKTRLRHKENRFRVVYTGTGFSDAVYEAALDAFVPVADATVAAGPSSIPFSEMTNIYDGAERTWWEGLRHSSLMVNTFSDVRLRYPDTFPGAPPAGNASADGAAKLIRFNGDNARAPQGRISHEMGHIASYLANPFKFCGAYNRPDECLGDSTACTGDWSLHGGNGEWYCASFEEGLATFIGDVSYYWHQAVRPTTCVSIFACTSLPYDDVELSLGTGCANNTKHRPINVDRYLRDTYDSHNDATYVDDVNFGLGAILTALQGFGTGAGNWHNGGINEPWDAFLSQIDDKEGRSARDFRKVLSSDSATATQYEQNCSPGHD